MSEKKNPDKQTNCLEEGKPYSSVNVNLLLNQWNYSIMVVNEFDAVPGCFEEQNNTSVSLKANAKQSKKVSLNDLFSMVTFLLLFPLNPFVLKAFQIEGAGRAPNDREMLLKVLEAEAGLA